ncbi:hypothetical protein [Aquimarina spongiae]|uniref:Uncharacterized protein n=1 Tax=Aquimarina spongiae TaxID=570521 RepID=A0A1M6BKN6_9FLAO|nr:hypothetical protein [Aquimarina spongiae]SHI49053.1 hypothetical protein SAMN04488508_101877 [Aquimarina spongiae]
MRFLFVLTLGCLLYSTPNFAQHLDEKDWSTLSDLASSGNMSSFNSHLKQRNFLEVQEPNEKYVFYQWNQESPYFYGVRINKKTKQVAYLTNDNNYVLKLLSKFLTKYTLSKSDKKDNATTHVFQAPNKVLAIKLDTKDKAGTHLLIASNN